MEIEKKTPFASKLHQSHNSLNGDLPEARKKNFESKYHDIKVKSLKQQSTLVCIFSYAEKIKNKNKNKIKVHKVHKRYHCN